MVLQGRASHPVGASLLGKNRERRVSLPPVLHHSPVTASKGLTVYLEVGSKRVFAGAIEWPGWSRGGRDESAALEALLAYGTRYRRAVGRAAAGLVVPEGVTGLDVRERLQGNATTDFGAPGVPPAADSRPLEPAELERHLRALQACWRAFDRAARAAKGAALAKGPRGGGRELDAIVRHVLEADAGYLRMLGTRDDGERRLTPADAQRLHRAIVAALSAAPRSGAAPAGPRGGRRWTIRYFIRRSAWHALDHAWEIEDRAPAGSSTPAG